MATITPVRMTTRYIDQRQPRYDCETAPPMIGPRVGPATTALNHVERESLSHRDKMYLSEHTENRRRPQKRAPVRHTYRLRNQVSGLRLRRSNKAWIPNAPPTLLTGADANMPPNYRAYLAWALGYGGYNLQSG